MPGRTGMKRKDCEGCPHYIAQTYLCTYRHRDFHCVKDAEAFKAEKEREEREHPKLF